MFRRSIYYIKQPQHPHLPILQYKRRPLGHSSRPLYIESWPSQGYATSIFTSKSKSTSTAMATVPCSYAAVVVSTSTMQHYKPGHLICSRETRHWHQQFFWSLVLLNSTHNFRFDLIQLWFQADCTIFSPIWFDSRLTDLFLTRVIEVKSHSSQSAGSPTLVRVSSKYLNTEILEYSTILIIEIGFSENTLTKN